MSKSKVIGVGMMLFFSLTAVLYSEYKETKPVNKLPEGAVAVTEAGNYTKAGTTYVLMKDIASDMTPIFLGKDVTLDLNGHSVTFADGKYEHIPNYGFEEGLKHWDTSKAPGAKVVSTVVRPLVGKKFCLLPEGQEIVSEYITLPKADRSYYAMCAISEANDYKKRKVTLTVEDENGDPVRCEFKGGRDPRIGGSIENIAPKKGGGVVFTHLHYLPAGKYRLRIKATNRDCQIDQCDIRPAFDVGIAAVGKVAPWATYRDVLKYHPCDFFDYCQKDTSKPVDTIPFIKGEGSITIKNGIVRNGFLGARSTGIVCNARDVTLKLENVKVINAGLNANAVRASKAIIKDCRFEVDTPFIINRHSTSKMSVQLGQAIEISHSEFIGGQGCMSTRSGNANIHDNLFVNAQTVTNHYSISPGTGDRIYNNRFEPRIGSGIYIGRSHDVEVFNNIFKITAAPPNCEYRYTKYSTNAIRLSDYNAKPGPKACRNNRVYKNKIYITGRAYPEYKGYTPHTYAFFISVGGGTNYIYDNEIFIENKDPDSRARAYAFFIGGSDNGGEIYNNKVTSNCTAAWIGNSYGRAGNTKLYKNTFIKAKGAPAKFKPVLLGSSAKEIEFYSNEFKGWTDVFQGRSGSYVWGWTLTVKVLDKKGKPLQNRPVAVQDKEGKEVIRLKTDDNGSITTMLPEYRVNGKDKVECSDYTVMTGEIEIDEIEKKIRLTEDMTVIF